MTSVRERQAIKRRNRLLDIAGAAVVAGAVFVLAIWGLT
jgi:hypothetical protein